jgi:hypothetical protein
MGGYILTDQLFLSDWSVRLSSFPGSLLTDSDKVVLRAGRPSPTGSFLVLISVRPLQSRTTVGITEYMGG